MKNDEKPDKTTQMNAILYAFYALKAKKVVKSQRDFARLVGVHEQSLSAAMRGQDQYLTESLVRKIEEFATEHEIDIWQPAGFIIQGDGGRAHIGSETSVNTDNSEQVTRLLGMLDERDAQISRLLTLLENEQRARGICQ